MIGEYEGLSSRRDRGIRSWSGLVQIGFNTVYCTFNAQLPISLFYSFIFCIKGCLRRENQVLIVLASLNRFKFCFLHCQYYQQSTVHHHAIRLINIIYRVMKHAFNTTLTLPRAIKSKTSPRIRTSFLVKTAITTITVSTEKLRLLL